MGHAFLETTLVNVLYGSANLIRGQDTGKITPASWRANLRQG